MRNGTKFAERSTRVIAATLVINQLQKPLAPTAGRTGGAEVVAQMITNSLLNIALSLRNSGLSTIPIRTNGSKEPAIRSWKKYQQRRPTESELRKWFGNGNLLGIAVIAGKVSRNLEIIDFDAPDLIVEWRGLVEESGSGLLSRLPQVLTPSGGLHVFYRCKRIAGNAKLAQREVEASVGTKGAREREGRWFKVETAIETRGEGGDVITAGSPAACHPSGRIYRLIKGDLMAVPVITEREREILLDCARSFNEHEKPSPDPKRALPQVSSLRPGDDFNVRGDARATLEKHGWKYLRKGSRGELWRRPGADHTSATLFPDGSLFVFSTNAHPFEPDRRYDRFSIYSLLEHNGDWKAAAKALSGQGYGGKKKIK
ncbi:MAG: bifunctional DNA primase/polymerase [Acidobacteria bacterium]|nr:bifunctional DNA primase/polymerase [Acidobacteriota bacterium]